MIKIGIVGGTGYTGVELLRLLAQHPEADVRAITSRKDAGTRVADMFPSLRGRYDLAFADPARRRSRVLRRRVLRDAARRRDGAGARAARRRGEDHRPRRRLPAQGSGRVREVVRDAAHLPRPPRRIGLRPARNEPRRDPQGAHRRQSGLLSDRGAAGLPAAARGRDRRHRAPDRRLQVRRLRRRAARPRWACCSPRRPTTSRPTASRATGTIRRSSRASNAAQQDAGEARVHAAPDADDPRHPRDALRAAHGHRRRPAGAVREALRRRAVRRRDAGGLACRTRARCARRTSAGSPCTGRRAATWRWSSRSRTTSSRAPPARRSRT